jgi:hypothetical protein
MLEEELIIGLKVLAKIHSGEIDVTCSNCDEHMKEHLHCNRDSDEIVFTDDDLGEFCVCPLKFLTPQVYDFYDEYSYYQIFTGVAPNYNDKNNRFWEACKIYKREYDQSSTRQMNKPKKSNSDESLMKLRNNFAKKGKK